MKKTNAGFSLIELIVVVAIMAIAVGLIAPQLLKYIEKTNVSSDMQLADTVRSAVTYAIVDVEVLADQASHPYLDLMNSSTGMDLDNNSGFLSSDCTLKDSLETSLGFPPSDIISQLRSAHGSNTHCNVKTVNNQVIVTFTSTDQTGAKDTANDTPGNDIFVD